MSEWLISRDMNMTRANVVGNLLHPENWGKKKNPAATPSALADWGFVVGRDPSPLGETLVAGTLSWQEACILSLAKRGPGDGDAPVKPFVAMMKVLAALQGKPGAKLKFTARSFTRLSAITSYADITDEFCLGINDPDRTGEPALSSYRDIWLNALAESGLFIRNEDDYELIVSDIIMAFVSQVAKFGEKISPCPSKRINSDAYYAYMGAVETGLPEIFDLMDSNVIWSVFPHFQKIGTAHGVKTQVKVLQQIYYGAPGTGKSHKTKEETDKWKDNVFRTTFHPDSDYSTFVGAYKPSMSDDAGRVEVYKGSGASKVLDATHEIKKGISYEFIPQAFIKAYVLAWKKMNDAQNGEDGKPNPEPVFLVIEEINRGNCAQIFGDIFQLLDRNDAGYSEYPIDADEDLKKFLSRPDDKGGLGGLDADAISTKFGVEKKEVELIRAGKHLMLPPNLQIRATMNTSDQSLFPIDSAFKRRWDWEYVPITEGKDEDGNPLGWKIAFDVPKKVEGAPDSTEEFEYDWWEFVKRVNEVIDNTTHSEDKKLGYFFVKPMEEEVGGGKKKVISVKRFLEKVIFYLWNDVFKDYGLDKIFTKDDKPVAFHQFFDRKTGAINVVLIKEFIEKLPEVKE